MATEVGVKARKAPGIIQKLDESVVNRIAAGEVIQRPANALKELIENSLDAGANNINISVKSGGLKFLQIQDDGSGIRKEDLSIVCERFTTSKLKTFEDLEEIATYGFRGEALASISHVAHLSITSKTFDSQCAYKAEYMDSNLKVMPNGQSNPKPCAGNQGTIITVEDLFYNMDTRKRALKSTSDEHNKIVDVVSRYAIHNSKVGFSVKKLPEGTMDIRTPANSTTIDNIRIVYGTQISRELLELKCEEDSNLKIHGYISNVNFSTKKYTILLFINHRLVDSTAIRKAIDNVYGSYLPKGTHPFLYLSLEMNPRNLDVNVHPTKHEVHFLHEEAVVKTVATAVEGVLLGSNHSRTFFVQSLLPGATASQTATVTKQRQQQRNKKCLGEPSSSSQSEENNTSGGSKTFGISATPYQKDMVRTDKNLQKLDKFVTSTPRQGTSDPREPVNNDNIFVNPLSAISKISTWQNDQRIVSTPPPDNLNTSRISINSNVSSSSMSSSTKRREMRLRSVKKIVEGFTTDCHSHLLSVLRNHIFVGCVDRTRALIQYETKLYMVNTCSLSKELFFQKLFYLFGNFGRIEIGDPTETIKELILKSLAYTHPDVEVFDRETMAEEAQNIIMSKSKMLADYFSLHIDNHGFLRALPLLLENYFPAMEFLPLYLWNLAHKVIWTNEAECFQTFALQTATFYAIQPGGDVANNEITDNGNSWKWTAEHVVYPEVRKSILPPKIWSEDATVIQLADLPDLYKVFERC